MSKIVQQNEKTSIIIIKHKTNIVQVLVDTEDVERLSKHSWFMMNRYAACKTKGKNITLHRFLLNPPKDMQVDHINRNTLDNRKSNLRICTQAQNAINREMIHQAGLNPDTKSQFRYVYKNGKNWRAKLVYGSKPLDLGTYKNKDEAIQTVNIALNNLVFDY